MSSYSNEETDIEQWTWKASKLYTMLEGDKVEYNNRDGECMCSTVGVGVTNCNFKQGSLNSYHKESDIWAKTRGAWEWIMPISCRVELCCTENS